MHGGTTAGMSALPSAHHDLFAGTGKDIRAKWAQTRPKHFGVRVTSSTVTSWDGMPVIWGFFRISQGKLKELITLCCLQEEGRKVCRH